jgi:hypothetical protein
MDSTASALPLDGTFDVRPRSAIEYRASKMSFLPVEEERHTRVKLPKLILCAQIKGDSAIENMILSRSFRNLCEGQGDFCTRWNVPCLSFLRANLQYTAGDSSLETGRHQFCYYKAHRNESSRETWHIPSSAWSHWNPFGTLIPKPRDIHTDILCIRLPNA